MEPGLLFTPPSSNKARKTLLALSGILGVLCVISVVSYCNQPSLSASATKQYQFEEQEFQDYMKRYHKQYTPEEYESRFYIFTQNSAFIRIHNSLNKSWTLGYNEFTDLSPEEFKSIYLQTTPAPRIPAKPLSSSFEKSLKIPLTIDWRTQGAVTPVGNQGSCKGGWAFAAAGAIEGVWKIAGNPLVALSKEQLVSCSSSYGADGCNGGLPEQAFEYVIGNPGLASDKVYPFNSGNGIVNNCVPTLASQTAASISGYANVAPVDDPAALIAAITQQPIAVGVEADQYVWQYYKTGVITNNCGTNINHFALVVGYNNSAQVPYYIVKNSWGANWGMSGYLYIAIGSDTGVCGIQMLSSYPTL
ncbi:unnamed protein product [Blepharisma stoltei]|uniref:Uncharacterized protein n=1 Tax=Blepharisma stoltei TaxID=1481888 RepID=A0AAU9J0T0_9CILI|nr:unnamed protein product [Blepharisma stoltei]